jgi:hypothetical protein
MNSKSTVPTDGGRQRDLLKVLWLLLGLLLAIEALYGSRWFSRSGLFRPGTPAAATARASESSLRALLQQRQSASKGPLRVWYSPYTPFPEAGYVESGARTGVYDIFLTFPPQGGINSNYGATKLSAPDGAFSLASIYGLGEELALAQRIGYQHLALDLGAITEPEEGVALCQRSRGCVLSSDSYALFPISASSRELQTDLSLLKRRISELPMMSTGPSWRSLVFESLAFKNRSITASKGARPYLTFSIEATPKPILEIFRYPLSAYPPALRPWLNLANEDVKLSLLPQTAAAVVCIGKKPPDCGVVRLSAAQPSAAIGSLLIPGKLNKITLLDLKLRSHGANLLKIEVKGPAAGQSLAAYSLRF